MAEMALQGTVSCGLRDDHHAGTRDYGVRGRGLTWRHEYKSSDPLPATVGPARPV
jgi:hypothetical protein